MLLQDLDQRRPARGTPKRCSYSPSPSSLHKHTVLPPPPGPPPSSPAILDIPTNPESPAKGPFTPVAGQVHQQPFAEAAPDHSPGPPSPSSPSNVGLAHTLAAISFAVCAEEIFLVHVTCNGDLWCSKHYQNIVLHCAMICCAVLCPAALCCADNPMLCSTMLFCSSDYHKSSKPFIAGIP